MGNFVIKCKAKEIGQQLMEYLRDTLSKSIEVNGRESLVTVKLSQDLDMLIVKETVREMRY